MSDMLQMEREREEGARDFVCKLVMLVYIELERMTKFPGEYDNDSEKGVKMDWRDSNLRQIFVCIYDAPWELPENRKSAFKSLVEKYGLMLNYGMLFAKLDLMYRDALSKANLMREACGLEAYPSVEDAR